MAIPPPSASCRYPYGRKNKVYPPASTHRNDRDGMSPKIKRRQRDGPIPSYSIKVSVRCHRTAQQDNLRPLLQPIPRSFVHGLPFPFSLLGLQIVKMTLPYDSLTGESPSPPREATKRRSLYVSLLHRRNPHPRKTTPDRLFYVFFFFSSGDDVLAKLLIHTLVRTCFRVDMRRRAYEAVRRSRPRTS